MALSIPNYPNRMDSFNSFKNNFLLLQKHLLNHPLPYIILLSFILRIFYLLLNYPLWWDSHIYISMGKYLFSNGQLGIWESFRPLLHPFLLGFFWKIGLDPIVLGKILDLFLSVFSVYLVYLLGKKIFSKKVALIGSLIYSLTPIFLMITGLILADPLALVLGLGGIVLLVYHPNSPRYLFLSGFLLAASFLTRFPYGIWFGAAFLILLCYKEPRNLKLKTKIFQIISLTFGFLLPTVFYLWLNWHLYQNILGPFQSGSFIVTTATWLYGSGFSYYFQNFFLQYSLYLFSLGYFYFFFKEQSWKDWQKSLLALTAVLTIFYFIYVPRKEIRYMIVALPFLSLLAAEAIFTIYLKLKFTLKPIINPRAFIFVIIILLLLPLPLTFTIERGPTFEKEITLALQKYPSSQKVLTSDPSFVSGLDLPFRTLDGMEFAPKIYSSAAGNYRLIILNDCDLSCSQQDQICLQKREELLNQIHIENKLIYQQGFHFRKQDCIFKMYVPK